MLYIVVAALSALWMWLRESGMLVASNWTAVIDIVVMAFAVVWQINKEERP